MSTLIVYDDDGKITHAQHNSDDGSLARKYRADGNNAFSVPQKVTDIAGVYVVQTLAPRPGNPSSIDKSSIIADGIDAAIIVGVPEGAAVQMFDGLTSTQHVADGTPIEFATGVPGVYRLHFEKWPYISWSYEITARAPA